MPKPPASKPAPTDIYAEKTPGVKTDKEAGRHDLEPGQTERRQENPQAKEARGLAETDPRRLKTEKPS